MNCSRAERMVGDYLNHDLSVRDMEDFLEHVQNCPACYDELETYFFVSKVVDQLDGQENHPYLDIKMLLDEEIRRSLRIIQMQKIQHTVTMAGIWLGAATAAGIVAWIAFQMI